MSSMIIDPRRDQVELYHTRVQAIAMGASCEVDIPISSDGATMYTLHVGSTGRYKFTLKQDYKDLLVLFNTNSNLSLEADLGIEIKSGSRLYVVCQNLDCMPADCYVSMRYSNVDLYERFNREFTQDLESKLERT